MNQNEADRIARWDNIEEKTNQNYKDVMDLYLKRDAKRRMKAWQKENDERDDSISFVIIVAVAILIGDFVLRIIY